VIEFVRHLVEGEGADLSGRWMAARLPNGPTYYRERLAGERMYDTNDISDFAELWEMTPQAFVRAAVAHAKQSRERKRLAPVTPISTLNAVDEGRFAAKSDVIDVEEEGDPIP